MIEALKGEELINKLGGRFKLTALIQKRWVQLIQGERPLVERGNKSDLEVVVQEIVEGKIGIDYEQSYITPQEQFGGDSQGQAEQR